MTTATILPPAWTVFLDANGAPLVGGSVGFYVPPNTSTPKTTWQDATQSVANTNPVILDNNGAGKIYGSGQYYMVVEDSSGNLIWNGLTQDTYGLVIADLGAMAFLGISGNSGGDDGTGDYAPFIFNTFPTGTTRSFALSDWGNLIIRSNSGTAMTDTLSFSAPFQTGWYCYLENGDGTASLTLAVGAGGAIFQGAQSSVTSLVVASGERWMITADGNGNYRADRITSNTLVSSAPLSAFQNLTAGWASNTTATLSIGEIAVEDTASNLRKINGRSITYNTATTGAGGLDTGTLAASTWYYGYIIYNATTDTAQSLFSLSSSAPTLPSGYTFSSSAITAFRTDGSKHLLGFIQKGREWQYIVGDNLSALPTLATGSQGSVSVPTYVSTAWSTIAPTNVAKLYMMGIGLTSTTTLVAPNNSYGSNASTSNPPPLNADCTGANTSIFRADIIPESANLYYAGNAATSAAFCFGFQINI